MTKQEFWAGLSNEQRKYVIDCIKVQEILKTFDGMVTNEVFDGVEPLPDPECHIPWSAYEAY